jgi:hypothetical protein
MEVAFFSIFLIKEEQQELLAQIIDELNSFINNPLFAEYGRIGLFVMGSSQHLFHFHQRSLP